MELPFEREGTAVWVDLSVPAVDRAAAFYRRLLDWTLAFEETPLGMYVSASVPAGTVGGMMAPPPGSPPTPPAWTVFFGVRDVDATAGAAKDAGAEVLAPPMDLPAGDRIAVLQDPAGAMVGIMDPVADGACVLHVPGAVTWVEVETREPAVTRDFYTGLFGWAAHGDPEEYASFRHGTHDVGGLMRMPEAVPSEVPGYWLVYFAVHRARDACRIAESAGGSVVVPASDLGDMRFAVLADPCGATFGVLEATAE